MANYRQELAGTSKGYIQFPVNPSTVFLRHICQKLQLISPVHTERVDNDIPFATLEAFHGVYQYILQRSNTQSGNLFLNQGYLTAIRSDDT